MSELGKISGKLLNANLVRNGVDLTFRNNHSDSDFFYLNTTINNIGINTDNPLYDLDVSGRLETNDLNIGSSLIIGNVSFNANSSISTTTGNLNIVPTASSGSVVPADIYSDPLGLAGSYSSNSVAVDQINYTQSQVESWIGKLLMTWNGESFPVTFYEILGVIDEPLDPGVFWRIVLDSNISSGEEFYQFSIYPNEGLTSIVGTAGYTAATDYSRSFLKTSLPPLFATTVTEDWTCQIGESVNIIDSVEEDPANSNWWKVNFKDIATPTTGIPIFTSPSITAPVDAYLNHDRLATSALFIDGNLISATLSNSNINFDPAGTGTVNLLEPTNITGDLQVNQSITLTGNMLIGGTITIGNAVLDNIEVTSDFGLSIIPSENNAFDLGNPTDNWSSVEVVTADVENLTQNSILIDNKIYLAPNGNDIRIIDSNSPLEIRSDTNNIFLEALKVNQNEIENLRNTPLTFTSIGIGYYVISDNNGFVIPVGTTAERVGNEVGDTRWNSEIGWLECYDGSTWYVATGPGDFLSLEEMEDLGNLYSIILG